MAITKLDHYTIRTDDLEATERFYTQVLHLRAGFRPAFDFPGAWLYAGGEDAGAAVVHLVSIDRRGLHGTGAVDHIAFLATDWPEMRARCAANGVAYEQRSSPSLGLYQVFLRDPSGVTIELNYPFAEAEAH